MWVPPQPLGREVFDRQERAQREHLSAIRRLLGAVALRVCISPVMRALLAVLDATGGENVARRNAAIPPRAFREDDPRRSAPTSLASIPLDLRSAYGKR
jgi:hypothetical protein